jgi:hypothetical protein
MLKDIILKNGYVKKGYGYYKETNVGDEDGECIVSHWITVFGDPHKNIEIDLQMYSYYKEDPEGEKIYDTSTVEVNESQLQVLIDVLVK